MYNKLSQRLHVSTNIPILAIEYIRLIPEELVYTVHIGSLDTERIAERVIGFLPHKPLPVEDVVVRSSAGRSRAAVSCKAYGGGLVLGRDDVEQCVGIESHAIGCGSGDYFGVLDYDC